MPLTQGMGPIIRIVSNMYTNEKIWNLRFGIWDLCDFNFGKKELIEVLIRVQKRAIGQYDRTFIKNRKPIR